MSPLGAGGTNPPAPESRSAHSRRPRLLADLRADIGTGSIVVAILAFSIATLCDAAAISLMSRIIDQTLAERTAAAFWDQARWWILVAVLAVAASCVGTLVTARASERFKAGLRTRMFDRVLGADSDDQRGPGGVGRGDLLSRVTNDVDDVQGLAVTGIVDVAGSAVAVVVFATAAIATRWDLALVLIGSLPVLWLINRALERPAGRAARAERVADAELTTSFAEAADALTAIQTHNAESTVRQRFTTATGSVLGARMRTARLLSVQGPVREGIEMAVLVAVLGLGCLDIGRGVLTVGGLVAFLTFAGFLYPPLTALGEFGVVVARGRIAAERVREILRLPSAVPEQTFDEAVAAAMHRSAVPLSEKGFGLAGITFSRTRPSTGTPADSTAGTTAGTVPVLDDVSVRLFPGTLAVLAGPSGSGKSTLAGLFARLHDPERGSVSWAGNDLRTMSAGEARELTTLVPQEPVLVGGSIAEAVRFGRAEAPTGELRLAAEAADVLDVVEALPQRWNTPLGSGGAGLSGGQRQRLALARAYLRDTPVLVLDEPTSGLDPLSARRVMTSLREWTHQSGRDRITLVATHDLEHAALADLVILLEGGRVRATGTHQELLERDGLYRDLVQVLGPDDAPRPVHARRRTAGDPAIPEAVS